MGPAGPVPLCGTGECSWEAQGERQGARLAGPEQRRQGTPTDRPGQASWRWGLGSWGGLRVRRDPAPGPLTVGHVRPAGVFFSSGPRWRAARQLTVRALHGLGVGRAPVANKVLQELRCLTAQLDSYEGEWGPGRLCPARPTALKPLSTPRPALPAGPAPLGSLQHHLHAPLRSAVRLPGSCVPVPAGPR